MPRIISGLWRGRPLRAPAGSHTRPTADRVKEAVFSSVQYRLEGAAFLDVCAGTGSMGLEALSRGARRADLVEADRRACRAIEQNIRSLAADGARLHATTWARALPRLKDTCYDLVYLDPPYREGARLGREVAGDLMTHGMLRPEACFIQETSAADPVYDYSALGLILTGTKTYGDTRILYYRPENRSPGAVPPRADVHGK